jgi:sulfur carrier protein
MKLYVNGENINVAARTIDTLIKELGVDGKVTAAAVNMEVVKKDAWETKELQEGDRVELLRFVGGG